ncbi:unnamed protein product, partial [Mesorhabditis belari]|uniref:Uncharacterized protein n=1 Tax=Mesorhabditis belari TaxID=2138241 RepID=A0AAF3F946_9BILA
MITLRFTDLQNDNAIMVLQVKVREMFAQLGEEYARLLKEQIPIVKKLEDVDGILQKSQELQQGRYGLSKAEFLSEASMNLPNIDQTMLAQMLDNYKDSVSVEFRKHENEFEAQVRTHLNMEKLKAKMEGIRAKQQETQRKFNDEKRKTQDELNEMQKKLDQEKQARESAEKHQAMHPMIMMMKEMNENSMRHLEQMRADREERERREQHLADERAHQRQVELEMLRQERTERERREVAREARLAEIENHRRAQERIRQEATDRLRLAEERRRQEAIAAQEKQKGSCRLM